MGWAHQNWIIIFWQVSKINKRPTKVIAKDGMACYHNELFNGLDVMLEIRMEELGHDGRAEVLLHLTSQLLHKLSPQLNEIPLQHLETNTSEHNYPLIWPYGSWGEGMANVGMGCYGQCGYGVEGQ